MKDFSKLLNVYEFDSMTVSDTGFVDAVFCFWQIAARPGARHFRCLFRVMFVPLDAYDLLKEDPVAFEYFYMQVSALQHQCTSVKRSTGNWIW